ncbi:hypothetical protein RINTHM_660 [Richelia intracellularis HM01]|nr:hypothetical protein RINTHM_660 [Richelia intracellularis HM01]
MGTRIFKNKGGNDLYSLLNQYNDSYQDDKTITLGVNRQLG